MSTEDVRIDVGEVAETLDEIGVRPPAPVTGVVKRPDGRPGFAERYAGAELLPAAVANARAALDAAYEGGDAEEIKVAQRELADVAGYELREVADAAAPPGVDRATAAELVATDLLNSVRPADRGGDTELRAAYERTLQTAVDLRLLIERAPAGDPVPPPPASRARIAVVEGQPWLWHPERAEWVPLVPSLLAGLDEETRAAVAAHLGPEALQGIGR